MSKTYKVTVTAKELGCWNFVEIYESDVEDCEDADEAIEHVWKHELLSSEVFEFEVEEIEQ